MDLFEKAFNEYIQVKKQSVCKHKTTVVEDGMLFCVSCGEDIHRIISTEKDELARFPHYSQKTVYRFGYDRTKRFTRFLDECAVDTKGVRVEIIKDFERVTYEMLGLSTTHGKSKSKSKSKSFMNLNLLLYQLCKKNGIDVDKSKFKLPKSKKSREKHENICQEIFRKLG